MLFMCICIHAFNSHVLAPGDCEGNWLQYHVLFTRHMCILLLHVPDRR
uniref:Uncharacterized protein n=1 Tax=Anguilla anguilla TaxID=7936 RepID=A0A0E9PK74_ANGAN